MPKPTKKHYTAMSKAHEKESAKLSKNIKKYQSEFARRKKVKPATTPSGKATERLARSKFKHSVKAYTAEKVLRKELHRAVSKKLQEKKPNWVAKLKSKVRKALGDK